jgi:methylated-DNA-protein-cysteine methyltransferase-like protein
MKTAESFRERVLELVRLVPEGRVTTYGTVALLVGAPRAARQVGMVLRGLRPDEDVPWQRVVNARGGISTYRIGTGELQRALLEAEGVRFNAQGLCDLHAFAWRPSDDPH